MLTSFGIKLVT